MIVDLDDERSLDPGRVGAKAAWLAQGRRAGLPVLPGLIVESRASSAHMRLGDETLEHRGSGGARLAMSREPIGFDQELMERASRLGPVLVARSSTALEASGEWAGAFTSYLDLEVTDLARGVVGCWASVFSVDTLERLHRAGVSPSSVTMAVLIQPAVTPDFGGVAEVLVDGAIEVTGVEGSPVPLLQGWAVGEQARNRGSWHGALVGTLGLSALSQIAESLIMARQQLGITRCEWAIADGTLWLLQLGFAQTGGGIAVGLPDGALDDDVLVDAARAAVISPGPLGEDLVLPWALRWCPLPESSERVAAGRQALRQASELRDSLIEQVWGVPAGEGLRAARECFRTLRGPDPEGAIEVIRRLSEPDPGDAARLMGLVAGIRLELTERKAVADPESAWFLTPAQAQSALEGERHIPATRFGIGIWEPFVAAVVLMNGERAVGSAASSGIGAGRRCPVSGPRSDQFRPRQVVTTDQPLPTVAPLLWDAAALVTSSGSRVAHLFESARALGVPSVCGVDLADGKDEIVAVDGHQGLVSKLPLERMAS